jgi:hypothetical protein
MYDSIIVVGNGKTSRANVEALIDDYFYANPSMTLSILTQGMPSEGQVWATQYAEEKSIKVETVKELEAQKPNSAFFVLYDENDKDAVEAVKTAGEIGVPAFDLTNGLHILTEKTLATPVEVSEVVSAPEPVVVTAVEPKPAQLSLDLQKAIENLVIAILAEVKK